MVEPGTDSIIASLPVSAHSTVKKHKTMWTKNVPQKLKKPPQKLQNPKSKNQKRRSPKLQNRHNNIFISITQLLKNDWVAFPTGAFKFY